MLWSVLSHRWSLTDTSIPRWTGREGELWSWKSGILMKRGRHEREFANIDRHLIGLMDIKRFEVAEEDCDSSSIDLGKVSDMSI